eukprot:TRINITY_DN7733_c0_g1_i1.p2 TRINITY_DN7733_c0_g1~~TRINITY_DN7733_c0_g1_i1.p2  ORF type:complete len:119 (+),score=1.63 TRINITY_DN7733_c0_g1_i1:166-522(+)
MLRSLVGSEMCIRDSNNTMYQNKLTHTYSKTSTLCTWTCRGCEDEASVGAYVPFAARSMAHRHETCTKHPELDVRQNLTKHNKTCSRHLADISPPVCFEATKSVATPFGVSILSLIHI